MPCPICQCAIRDRTKDAISIPNLSYPYAKDRPVFYHKECFDKILKPSKDPICGDCGSQLRPSNVLEWHGDWNELPKYLHSSCPACGKPNPLGHVGVCNNCGLPIYERIHETVKGLSSFEEGDRYFIYHADCRLNASSAFTVSTYENEKRVKETAAKSGIGCLPVLGGIVAIGIVFYMSLNYFVSI